MGVGLFVFKIAAENWRNTGNVLGTNEIMKGMSGDGEFLLRPDKKLAEDGLIHQELEKLKQ